MTAIAGALTRSANISMDGIVTALITAKVLADDCKEDDRHLLAIRSILCLLGRLTFFYQPEPVDDSTALDIHMQDCSSFTTRSQQMQGSSRPFFDIVNVFNALGDLRTKSIFRCIVRGVEAHGSSGIAPPIALQRRGSDKVWQSHHILGRKYRSSS
jgi:hypothetical protein